MSDCLFESCPMHLERFPMDQQRCPLKLGSFGYTTRDVIYRWKEDSGKPVDIAPDLTMSQFDLVSILQGNSTETLRSGQYSFLLASFHLQRHMGNFLIQVYGPCTLLVVLSWVGFWLNREGTSDRISLGVTTVLTMTFLGLEARTDLPKVPYPTALDFFVFLSFAFVFATIVQFAVVHYFTKKGSGEVNFSETSSSSSEESDGDETECERQKISQPKTSDTSGSGTSGISSAYVGVRDANSSSCQSRHDLTQHMAIIEVPRSLKVNNNGGSLSEEDSPSVIPGCPKEHAQPRHPPPPPPRRKESLFLNLCSNNSRMRMRKRRRLTSEERQILELQNVNSVSKVDKFARIFFPLSFLCINAFYWYFYLYESNEDL